MITRRLRELDLRLGALDTLRRETTEGRYRSDLAVRAQIERHLQLAVQAVIDVAVHIVAEDVAGVPEDYGSAFMMLADQGLIDRSLAERLRDAAGLRNVLVHGYVDVDPGIVWQSLDDLDDLRQFAAFAGRVAEG
ncbi:hypothetical protein BH23ACT2_BH23ACT2_28630 [soil metagenome]